VNPEWISTAWTKTETMGNSEAGDVSLSSPRHRHLVKKTLGATFGAFGLDERVLSGGLKHTQTRDAGLCSGPQRLAACPHQFWQGWRSNLRMPESKSGALTNDTYGTIITVLRHLGNRPIALRYRPLRFASGCWSRFRHCRTIQPLDLV
jgi:hypothetical protein